MSLSLIPGTICVANGQMVQLDGPDSLTHMHARMMATGEMVSIPISKIEVLPTPVKSRSADEINEAEWKRCVALAQDFASTAHRNCITRSEWEKLSKRHNVSVRQLQRLRAAYLKDPRASALVRNPGGRPQGLNCLSPDVDTVVVHTIRKHYYRREKPTKAYVIERAQSLARRLKLPVPSRKAVLTRLAREDGWLADRARLGSKAAKQKWEVRIGGLSVHKPLDLVQIDHTPADVLVLTDDRLDILGRPWVTVAIDVATRCVVGLYVSMDTPSATSVALCIEHMVLPKRENHDDPELWPMYGKPRGILVDNGKDFRCDALKRGCDEHGIALSWRPVRTPHYGAHVERLIGTLMKIAHLLPGTTFSNVKERGDYKSEGKARLTLSEFRQWLIQKICRFYHPRRHRGLGIPPVVAWERGLTNAEGIFVAPPLLERPLDFRMDFLPTAWRKVRRTGIEFNGSRYWHDDLTPMLNGDAPARLRYRPDEPGQIWMRRPDGLLVTAPAIAGRAAGEPTVNQSLDKATQAKLNAEIDSGFEVTDQIEAEADRATRCARRGRPGRPGRKAQPTTTTPPPSPADIGHLPPMAASNGTSLPIEEWH